MRGIYSGMAVIALAVLFTGCATKTRVERVPVEEQIDLSGKWNDVDAMQVAEVMVSDALKRPWVSEFNKEAGRDPVVIVGYVTNRSDEHIASDVFVKYLERELLNSGRVVFVAGPDERVQLRNEREDQQRGFTDPATAAKWGRERGADLMMIGSIDSVRDDERGQAVVFYQVNLELVDLETNEKVWIGQKQIKKFVTKSRFRL